MTNYYNPHTGKLETPEEMGERPADSETVLPVGDYTMGLDVGCGVGDRSVLALAGPQGLVGFMDLEQGAPMQSAEALRTLHTNGDVGGILTWEEFRQAIEEGTGLRFPDRVEARVVEDSPILLAAPGFPPPRPPQPGP